ncbi:MAG TPA: VWA domain-containing protein [Vicinamibacterales bacterium]|nr:VWA domain-containing protein [Vicinamibacterales bacterium]
MHATRLPIVCVLILIGAAVVSTQNAPQGGAPPIFRTGVNLVRVDVIVADDDGTPVTDLRKEEFEIVEDGRPQTIDLFRHIRIDSTAPAASHARQVLNRDTEEREAARDDVRVFGILLADYQVCGQRSRAVRDAMAAFIRKLGPNDLIAVMQPLMSVRDLVFTYDHDAVLQTIRRFEGRRGDYTARNAIEEQHALQVGSPERIRTAIVGDALKALSVRLGSMREGRKSLIFVGEGFPPSWFTDVRQLREVTQEANRHNTSIYAIDPRGLVASGDASATIRPGCGPILPGQRLRMTQDTLRELSEETDGRAIVDRNALDDGLNQILRDSSFYYLLGYSSTASQADGKFHQIRVRVKRPRVDVRARKGYWASTAEDVSRAATPAPVTPQPVLDALATIAVPNQDGRVVRTWVGTARGADGKSRVTVISEVLAAAGASRSEAAAHLTVTATRPREAANVFESPSLELRPGTPLQLVSFDADAGALDVKIVLADREGKTIDRETRVIDVPDYSGRDAALGTPRFYRPRSLREFQTLAADADAIPVTTRDFARTDRLLIRFDATGAGGEPAAPTAAILSRAGRKMFDVQVTPSTAKGASHQIDLTLGALPTGEYLVEIAAAPDGPRQLAAFRLR